MFKAEAIGNLSADTEMKYTKDGTAVTKFTVVSNRRKKNGVDQGADFIRCVSFGKLAEVCGEYLKKGSKVYVAGNGKLDSYEKDGNKVYTFDIMVNEMEMLGSKKESNDE